jgi:hypothetical protein
VGLLLLAGAGAAVWFLVLPLFKGGVSDSALLTTLAPQAEGPEMSLGKLQRVERKLPDGSLSGTFTASAVAGASLYEKVDAISYLRDELKLDLDTVIATRSALESPAGARLAELAGVKGLPANPLSVVLLRESCAKGAAFPFQGSYVASRKDGKWQLEAQGIYPDAQPEGKKRTEFPASALVIGQASTESSLREAVARHVEISRQLVAAREKLAEEERHNTTGRTNRFNALLAPGSFFGGSLPDAASGQPVRVWLEITEADPATRKLKGLLRNEGSWELTRAVQASWSFDDEVRLLTLDLSSPGSQSQKDSGPLLSQSGSLALKFVSAIDSNVLSAPLGSGELVLNVVPASEIDSVKASLSQYSDQLLAALAKGAAFKGKVTNKRRNFTEELALRVVSLESDGSAISVVLISLRNPAWRRTLRGTLELSRFRSAGTPLRLRLNKADAIRKGVSPDSVFGSTLELTPALAVSTTGLTGEDERFSYSLEPVSGDELASLEEAARQSAGAAAATTTTAGSSSAPSSASYTSGQAAAPSDDLPDFPEAPGAYILKDRSWVALPSNGAKVGTSAGAVAGQIGSFFGNLAKGKAVSTASDTKTADLLFEGNAPQPRVGGNNVTLVFVGPFDILPQADLDKYPELRELPPVEVASAYLKNNGRRQVDLVRLAPGYAGFGSKRRNAVVDVPFEGITVLRVQGRLPAGYYAFGVRVRATPAYEFIVQN